MANTQGDNLSPVIQELLRRQQLSFRKRKSIKEQPELPNDDRQVLLVGEKVNGKLDIKTIVEIDKNGKISIEEVDKKGQLIDVTKQYQNIEQGNRLSDKDLIPTQELVPERQSSEAIDHFNKTVYAKTNVQTEGELDKKVQEQVNINLSANVKTNPNIEQSIKNTLTAEQGKISFENFNQKLSRVGLQANLEKTGEKINGLPKVQLEIYHQSNPNQKETWNSFRPETIKIINQKVNLDAEYQRRYSTDVVLAQRENLKTKLVESESTSNKIVLTKDENKVQFSFQDDNGNRELLKDLNRLPNHEAIQIAKQYNENIERSRTGLENDATAYATKIERAIPLQSELKNQQQIKIS